MEEIEDLFSLEELVWFRTLALYQLRIEAMSYVKARGNVRGKTHLGDLWDYYLNDFESLLGDPYKKVAEEREIELSEQEKDELNCLLNMDKLNIVNTYLNGKSSSRTDKLLQVGFEISRLSFFLNATRVPDLVMVSRYSKSQCGCQKCESSPSVKDDTPRKIYRPRVSAFDDLVEERQSLEPGMPKDAVLNLTQSTPDGRSCDPKLLNEHTIILVEFVKTIGDFYLQRDLQLISNKLEITDFYVFDPLSFMFMDYLEDFKRTYSYASGHSLVQIFIKNGANDYTAANALRFYMIEVGLLPELEFLYHFEEVKNRMPRDSKEQFAGSINLCICGKEFESYERLCDTFFDPENELFLHLPIPETNKILSAHNRKEALQHLNEQISTFMNDKVMLNFVKSSMR